MPFSKMDAIEYSYYDGDSVVSVRLYIMMYWIKKEWAYRMRNL